MKCMSWNGFPKRLATKLIQKFTPRADQIYNNSKNNHHDQTVQFRRIFMRFKLKVLRLLKQPCKFIIYWDNTTTGCFVSCKDKTPKEFQSSVVYKFSYPGCAKAYIGKTDRCLYTRMKEHASTDNKSDIYKLMNSCEQFQRVTNLLQLCTDELNNLT